MVFGRFVILIILYQTDAKKPTVEGKASKKEIWKSGKLRRYGEGDKEVVVAGK